MKVRAGNRYVDRPFSEMLWETIGTPFIVLFLWLELRRGW